MWIMSKGQYIVNQIRKDYPKSDPSNVMFSLPDEKYHVYEERYHKYLMKHIHPKNSELFCSAPEIDTRCTCAKCTAKYEKRPPLDENSDEFVNIMQELGL